MSARRSGLPTIVAALVMLASACTDGGPGPATTTTDPEATATTSTTAEPSSTTSAAPGTSSTVAPPDLADPGPPPELPSADVVAENALVEIPGFSYTGGEAPLPLIELLELDITTEFGATFLGLSWSGMVSEGGEELLVAAIYPVAQVRGDPAYPIALAASAAGFDDEPTETALGDTLAWTVELVEGEVHVHATNSVVFLAAGQGEPPLRALAGLVEAAEPQHLWQAGSCLWMPESDGGLPFAPYGEREVVPCDGAHTHEVIATSPLAEGPGAPYPGGELALRRDQLCGRAYHESTGVFLHDGLASLVSYMPDVDEWAEGDRYLGCVAYVPDDAGRPRPVNVTLDVLGEAGIRFRSPGDCHADTIVGAAIPCTRSHVFEYLGRVDLDAEGPFDGGEVDRDAEDACQRLLLGRARQLTSGEVTLEPFYLPPGPYEWDAGEAVVDCFAIARDDTGRAQLITGSVDDEWEVIAPAGGGITA